MTASTSVTLRNIPAPQTLVTYTIPGDADLDGAVTFNDFLNLQNGYNQPGDWAEGDFNYDGVVDYSDFLIMQDNFGVTLAGGTAVPAPWLAVPEPSSLALIAIAGGAMLTRRRRRGRQSFG